MGIVESFLADQNNALEYGPAQSPERRCERCIHFEPKEKGWCNEFDGRVRPQHCCKHFVTASPSCPWPRQRVLSDHGRRWWLGYSPIESETTFSVLREAGVEIYRPMTWVKKPVPRKKLSPKQRKSLIPVLHQVPIPLFPCYPFLKVDLDDQRWYDLLAIITAPLGLVFAGEKPWPVPEHVIARMRAQEVDGAIPGKIMSRALWFEVGETVRINEGAFIGHNATVEELPDVPLEELDESHRIKLLVSLFGRECHVEMGIADVLRI